MAAPRPPAGTPLKVLIVEDNPNDAALLVRSLNAAGYAVEWSRVDTEPAFLEALAAVPDLVVSDYSLPQFDGFRALDLLRGQGLEFPFILVSGSLGEDIAVQSIKRGADDYLLKDHLTRLGTAVDHALAARRLRDERQRLEAERLEAAERLGRMAATQAAILDALPAHIALLDAQGVVVAVNESWRQFARATAALAGEAGIGANYPAICEGSTGASGQAAREAAAGIRRVLAGTQPHFSMEYPCHAPDAPQWYRIVVTSLKEGTAGGALVTHLDVTERHLSEEALRRSEAGHRLLFESNPLPCWVYDIETLRFLAVNDAAVAEYGYSREAFLAMTIEDIRPEDEVAALRENVATHAESLQRSGVWRHRTASGDIRLVEVASHQIDFAGRHARNVVVNDVTARHKAEEGRQELLRRLSTTLESLTDGFLTVDHAWRLTYVNAEAERQLLRWRAELIGRDLFAAFPEMAGSTFEREFRRALADQVTVGFEECYAPLGRWFEVRAYPSEAGLAISFRDVTGVRAVREAVRASEERLRLLAQATNDAIWDWDMRAGTLWWNAGFERQFGFDLSRVTPSFELWASRLHPDDREAVTARVRNAVHAGLDHWAHEYRFRRADDTYAYVLDRGHVIRDGAGTAIRALGGMTDLTERRRIEEQLREQATLLDKAQDAIMVRDLEHRVSYWNHSAERLYGWPAAEVMGRPLPETLHRDQTAYAVATAVVLARGEWMGELEQVTRDGRDVTIEGRWTLVRDHHGQAQSILSIHTDVTQRKKLETQFLRAQRMESIGTLAGGIAHDLNNVLAPILMSIGLLQMDETDAERLDMLATIEASAKRGAAMVSQVLSFARGLEGRRIEVETRHLVRDLMKILGETFPKNIEFRQRISDDLWALQADPTQLHQVLLNLCVNARDAMPTGGRITIAAENLVLDEHYAAMSLDAEAGPYVRLEVEDTGTGIPPSIVEKIFDPFFTTKAPGQGTGLGLSTSLAIVKSHGGFVHVYSDPGIGTRIRVYLPAKGRTAAAAERPQQVEFPRGRGETVLVVDDEASIRQISKQTLEAFGYRVLVAADGSEAISIYVQHQARIAVVLTDMVMPVMDGPATIQVLLRLNPAVRIIAASGITASGQVAQMVSAGVKHFLPKPYTAETLLVAIHKALGESGA